MAKGSKFKVPISETEIKREETEPDQMPIFEMDSAYVEDRIKQEIKIEVSITNIVDVKNEDAMKNMSALNIKL